MPILDPRPPSANAVCKQKECKRKAGLHLSFNPSSKYKATPSASQKVNDLISRYLGKHVRGPSADLRFEHGVYAEVLSVCKAFHEAGHIVGGCGPYGKSLLSTNCIAFSGAHSLRCFLESWPAVAGWMIEYICVVAEVKYTMKNNFFGHFNKRAVGAPGIFEIPLSPFSRLKKVVVHFHGKDYGLPFEGKNPRGLLEGVDLHYWLRECGWQVQNAEMSGLDYVKEADSTLVLGLEGALTQDADQAVVAAFKE